MAKTGNSSSDLLILLFAQERDWATWLDQHHADSPGVWLRLAKKGAQLSSISYDEALTVALCYGWIDGQKRSYDEASWLQKFTPRRRDSLWSKVNREKAEALIANGRMQPAGLEAIARAKQNGRWDAAYDSASRASIPGDFQTALDQNQAAAAFFATLDSRNRYAILYRLQTAKTDETRARRMAQFIRMLADHEKLYP